MGFCRVNSFITGGKTRTTGDADLWAKHRGKKEEVEEAVSGNTANAIAIGKKKSGKYDKDGKRKDEMTKRVKGLGLISELQLANQQNLQKIRKLEVS